MKNITLLLICLICITSCTKDSSSPDIKIDNGSKVNFSNLAAGQSSAFEKYVSVCLGEEPNIALVGDTLLLETFVENSVLSFRESLTTGSTNYQEDDQVIYPVVHQGSYLLLTERESSKLFYFYGNDTIWINPTSDVELMRSNCSLVTTDLEPFIGNEIGHIETFEMTPISKSNKTAVSCVPPFMDLTAFLLYSNDGLVVSQVVDAFGIAPSLTGYALIE